jgi:sRNA-binding protein
MSSLPPSSTPPEGDDSAPVSLPLAADAVPESAPVAAPAVESPAVAEVAPAADAGAAVEPAADASAAPVAQEDCGPQLKKLYPALFSNPPKPLKLRIQADIQARSPGLFTKPQLSAFLRRYTGSHAYLNALVKATHRFDLDGNPGDELSDEHRTAAGEELARRRANTQARVALENEQRANRATLLKEFEANTLPTAEFAAAKGVPEAELEPLIARARKEALEPPPAPAFNRDRRGPRPEGQRNARPPRDARPAADGSAPPTDAPRPPRPPRADGPRPPRSDRPQGDRPQGARPDRPPGPRSDAPRADGPRGPLDAPRADRPRGPLDAPRGPRSDAPRNGPRPDSRGPRTDGARGPRPDGPRADAPRGPRRDDDRRPPRPDDRGPRPNVVSSPSTPTAMALAFSALNALKTKK